MRPEIVEEYAISSDLSIKVKRLYDLTSCRSTHKPGRIPQYSNISLDFILITFLFEIPNPSSLPEVPKVPSRAWQIPLMEVCVHFLFHIHFYLQSCDCKHCYFTSCSRYSRYIILIRAISEHFGALNVLRSPTYTNHIILHARMKRINTSLSWMS